MVAQARAKGRRVYFICHRKELITQTSEMFDEAGLAHSYIAAGMVADPCMELQICSIDTLKRRIDRVPPPDLAIWDEAHHVGAAGWAKVLEAWSKAYHVLLTATPVRLDGSGLGNWATAMATGPTVRELMDGNYLCPYQIYGPNSPDMTGTPSVAGEFAAKPTAALMNTSTITGSGILEFKRHAPIQQGIGFCASIEHSQAMAKEFTDAGIPSAHLDGNTDRDERERLVRWFKDKVIQVLWNVNLFSEGFNVPSASVLIDMAPTMSLSRYLQRVGRVMRYEPDKVATILDHAGNWSRHGLPDDDHEWSLAGRKPSRKASTDPINQCPKCYFVHKPAPACPKCGYEYPVKKRELIKVGGDLVAITSEDVAAIRERAETSYVEVVKLGRKRGYKNPEGWARHVVNANVAKSIRAQGARQ